jgi:hypothetical protein
VVERTETYFANSCKTQMRIVQSMSYSRVLFSSQSRVRVFLIAARNKSRSRFTKNAPNDFSSSGRLIASVDKTLRPLLHCAFMEGHWREFMRLPSKATKAASAAVRLSKSVRTHKHVSIKNHHSRMTGKPEVERSGACGSSTSGWPTIHSRCQSFATEPIWGSAIHTIAQKADW